MARKVHELEKGALEHGKIDRPQGCPIMTGDILSSELRKVRPDISVILCTGYSSRIGDRKAEQTGINAFLYKPISKTDYARTIRKLLDKSG